MVETATIPEEQLLVQIDEKTYVATEKEIKAAIKKGQKIRSEQVGDNIRGGVLASIFYLAAYIFKDKETAENASYVGAALDNVATATVTVGGGVLNKVGKLKAPQNTKINNVRANNTSIKSSTASTENSVPLNNKVTTSATNAAKTGTQFTKSSLSLGIDMHKGYKLAEHAPELGRFKEFTGIKGIRPDFVDFGTNTIYELKPFNPREIKLGTKQLNNYKLIFE